MKVARETLMWAFPSHVCFGICNFLIGYSNTLAADKWAIVGVLWFSSGLLGLAPAAYFYQRVGSVFFTSTRIGLLDEPSSDVAVQPNIPMSVSITVKVATVGGGLCVGLSQLLMKQSFAMAPVLTGPLCAVISSDTLVVSTVCHFVYNEKMNKKQAVAILGIVAGLVVMALFSNGGSSASETSAQKTTIAFVLALVGMFLFATAVLCIRIGCLGGLAAWSGFVVRMITILILGSLAFSYSVFTAGWPDVSWTVWVPPGLAGIFQALGVYCVNQALKQPNTGIANAIFASNSVLVLLLNAVIFGLLPNPPALIGMAIVVVGVASISLLEGESLDSPPTSPSANIVSPSLAASPGSPSAALLRSPSAMLTYNLGVESPNSRERIRA